PGGFLKADALDHLAATLPGRHVVEQGFAPVQYADTGRPEQLVRGEYIEVAVQRPHIRLQMRHRLGTVEQREGALRTRRPNQVRHRVDGAEYVGYMGQGQNPGARVELCVKTVQIQLAGIVDGDHAQGGAAAL